MWIIIVLAVLIAGGVISMLAVTIPIAKKEYQNMFTRDSQEKWGRANSCPEDADHSMMFQEGLDWGKANVQLCREVCIINDGLKLYGEYYDFGNDKCVIILPGRAESLLYSYYYAQPYQDMGYNVLVIDQRAHGKSEGIYSCVGIKETDDVRCWMRYIQNAFGISSFVIHGICIGSFCAIKLATEGLPFLKSIILEGPFTSFRSVLVQRTKAAGKPPFPFVDELIILFKKRAGVNVRREKPIRYIRTVKTPVLFLCGRQDYSSLPENCEKLYKLCGSLRKQIVWFDKGAHSHLRFSNKEAYDKAVEEFLTMEDI